MNQAKREAGGEKRWYVIQVFSGQEKRVKELLEERIRSEGYEELIDQVLLPTEDVEGISKGKKRKTTRKFFPGYLLIHMVLNERTWNFVRRIARVTGFVGDANKPVPIPDEDVERILARMQQAKEQPRIQLQFEEGETVRIMEGPFANFSGVVQEVNEERGRLRVMVSIFGRNTPVELDFTQVEKV